MRHIQKLARSSPVLFGLITVAAYGLLVPFTGFYWDDWPFAWIARFLGPAEFFPAFAPFRPFLAPIFFLTTSLVPPVPLYWQLFAVVIRFLLGLTAWWMFRSIWPQRSQTALGAALLLLIYPGYSQHWVAYTHINQELIPLLFYMLSFGLTARALRSPRPLAPTLAALLLQVCGLFPTEYFFGLEVLRGLFILSNLSPLPVWQRLRRTFVRWSPYLLVWLLNAAWLAYYYKSGAYASYDVTVSQTPAISGVVSALADALWKAGVYAWGQIVFLLAQAIGAPTSLLTLALILLAFPFVLWHLSGHKPTKDEGARFGLALVCFGLIGILAGRLPSLAAGLPLRLQSSYDRFMVSMMIGGSLFAVGLLQLLFSAPRARAAALAALVALGIGQQFYNANIFRRDWQKQGEIYWQMAWRMPGLETGTVLLTDQMPIDYETDLSFTAPLNWMYAPRFESGELPFALLYTEKRLGGPTLPSLEPGVAIKFPYRTVAFAGSTSQAVVIHMPRNGCLRVLDPERGDVATYARESPYLVDAIPLSDSRNILFHPSEAAVPVAFAEPEHNWCYFYTRAELARQQSDWAGILALKVEAETHNFAPEDEFEWLPFIEAHARTGDWVAASQLARQALAADLRIRIGLCQIWSRMQDSPASTSPDQAMSAQLQTGLGCPR